MLIDSHCHLNFKAFRKNLDDVLWRAREEGVQKIIVPGADLVSSKRAVELARSYENIYAAVGIHPHHCQEEEQKLKIIKNELRKLAENNKVVAIGECGLDYHQNEKIKSQNCQIDQKLKNLQQEIFLLQLELAREMKLPIIFHCREAQQEIKKVLKNFKNLKGVFHCFSGDEKFLTWVLKKGFYVGFDGNITYQPQWQKIIKIVPKQKILLETDAPFLTPEPLRSQKIFPNRPQNLKIITQFVAQIKGDSFAEIAKCTSQNTTRLFKLD